jgi:hypothetical protein
MAMNVSGPGLCFDAGFPQGMIQNGITPLW